MTLFRGDLLQGMKFRQTNIVRIVQESLAALDFPDWIDVVLKSTLNDEAVWMDHKEMVTVIKDLAQNAIDAMPQKGTLTLIIDGDEKTIIMKMTDTGKGITEDRMPLIFTPFFTTKPIGEGTGLGLPQAYATVKGHNGHMTVESNADPAKGPTGTTITITIPRKQKFQTEDAKIILHEEED